MEVIDKIRHGAENEQQSPDLEIDAERMLLPFFVMLPRRGGLMPRGGKVLPLCLCHVFSYQR
jgi:hypothetical protein